MRRTGNELVQQADSATSRLQSIQLLRAVAVIAVVLFHFGAFPDGRAGVDLFFCISGFVMAGQMGRSPRRFAIDRFVRIYPPFLVAMALTLWMMPQSLDLGRLALSLILYPNKNAVYLYPAWSLGYEAIFYLACVAAMLVGWRAIVLLYAVLLAFDVPYLGSAFILDFIAGFLIARRHYWALPILLLAAAWQSPRVLEYGSVGAVLLWLGVRFEQTFRDAAWRPLAAIGDASYAIYLTHVIVGTLLVGLAPPAVAIAACLLVGLLFHWWIETPLLLWCRNLASPPWRPAPGTAAG